MEPSGEILPVDTAWGRGQQAARCDAWSLYNEREGNEISTDIAAGLVVLLVVLFAKRALDVSSFPTLLLVTTLFRLGLNISTTRNILSKGEGGEVVHAFGHFVLQGDIVVGADLQVDVADAAAVRAAAERIGPVDILVNSAGVVVASLAGGRLSDRIGRRKIFVGGGAVVYGLAMFVVAFAGDFNTFLIGMAVAGLGFGTYMAVNLALVVDVLPDSSNAAKDLGVFNIAAALPSSIAPAVTPAILSIGGGSYGVLYALEAAPPRSA